MCHDFIVPTLQRRKNHIPNFGWKHVPTLVENNYTYKLGMHPWLAMGGSTT